MATGLRAVLSNSAKRRCASTKAPFTLRSFGSRRRVGFTQNGERPTTTEKRSTTPSANRAQAVRARKRESGTDLRFDRPGAAAREPGLAFMLRVLFSRLLGMTRHRQMDQDFDDEA